MVYDVNTIFHPLIIFFVNTSGLLIQHVVLPLLFLSAVLSIVSTLTDHYKVTKLATFLRNIAVDVIFPIAAIIASSKGKRAIIK